MLEERGLVDRVLNPEGNRVFKITGSAESVYFSNLDAQNLKLE